jgi:hypothetical protein
VESRCTCGVVTVDGALFCHKCGRPLFEQPAEPPESVPQAAPRAAIEAPLAEISFRNAVAVRVGFLVAGLAIFTTNLTALLGSIPLQFLSFIALSMASGYLAVWLYRRRTGQQLSVKGGAQLGWITGVLSFLIVVVILALTIALVGFEQLEAAFRDPAVSGNIAPAELERLLNNPAALATALVFTLVVIFGAYTVAASVGGAVGAKLLDRGDDRSF